MNTVMTKKLTTREQITNAFVNISNRYMATTQIQDACVGVAKQTVYSTISNMANAKPPALERRGLEGAYEYHLPEAVYAAILASGNIPEHKQPEQKELSEQPILSQTENVDLALPAQTAEASQQEQQNVEAQQIPEGKRARGKMWNAEDQRAFCLAFLAARDENPVLTFEQAARRAQKDFPEEKRKNDLVNRRQIPWFDREIERSKIEYEAHKAARAEEAARERAEQEAREQAQNEMREREAQQANMLNVLHGVGNDMLFGEILRRGQSLVETMLINALQSPSVQRALASSILGGHPIERRHHERPNFQAPEQQVRVRLEKVMVVGINKPQHQQLVISRMKDMYDMRMFASNTPAAQLKAAAIGADTVIVMTQHVGHHDEAAIKSTNVKYERMTGDRRALEDSLSKRYLTKDESNGK